MLVLVLTIVMAVSVEPSQIAAAGRVQWFFGGEWQGYSPAAAVVVNYGGDKAVAEGIDRDRDVVVPVAVVVQQNALRDELEGG